MNRYISKSKQYSEKVMLEEQMNEDLKPWYRQFWAWFILSPLITVVIVSSITVTLAVINADDRVVDNYYKEGRAINMRLDQDLLAISLGITARLRFDKLSGDLILILNSKADALPKFLLLELSHPAHSERDHKLLLTRTAANQYNTELSDELLDSRWYLRLLPLESLEDSDRANIVEQTKSSVTQTLDNTQQVWRLRGEIDFAKTQAVFLQPDG
jgi:hypothetical protein